MSPEEHQKWISGGGLAIAKRLQCLYQGLRSQDDVSLDGWPPSAGLGCPASIEWNIGMKKATLQKRTMFDKTQNSSLYLNAFLLQSSTSTTDIRFTFIPSRSV